MWNIEVSWGWIEIGYFGGECSIVMEILFAVIVAGIGGCWLHKSLSRERVILAKQQQKNCWKDTREIVKSPSCIVSGNPECAVLLLQYLYTLRQSVCACGCGSTVTGHWASSSLITSVASKERRQRHSMKKKQTKQKCGAPFNGFMWGSKYQKEPVALHSQWKGWQ